MSGAGPVEIVATSDVSKTDEMLDMIASIKIQRQSMEKEAGLAASCESAVHKLHELLEHEKRASQLHGAGSRHAANVEAGGGGANVRQRTDPSGCRA
jgi:hypothetical protein